MLRFVSHAAAAVICATAGTASAQPGAGSPTFATLDRQDGESKIGGSLAWTFYDSDGGGDLTGFRADLYGHYVGMSGLGGYGIIPVSMLFFDDDNPVTDDDSETAIGNIEGGVLYVIPTGAHDFVLRGGITLPTADDSIDGWVTNVLATLPRMTDLAHASPETFWLRLSASPILRSGQLVFRLDGGIDFAVSSDGEEPDPLGRLNVGGGVDTGSFAILGELCTLAFLGDEEDQVIVIGNDEDFLHTFAISGRFRAGALEPGVALGFPLDDALRDTEPDGVGIEFFLVAGLQGRI